MTDKVTDKVIELEKFRCRNCKHLHTLVDWNWTDEPEFFDICSTRRDPMMEMGPGESPCKCRVLIPQDNLEYLKDKYNRLNG